MQDDFEASNLPHRGETIGVSCGAGPIFYLTSDSGAGFMEPLTWDEEFKLLRVELAYLLSTFLQSPRRAAAIFEPYSRRVES